MTERSTVGRITFLQHVPFTKQMLTAALSAFCEGLSPGMRGRGRLQISKVRETCVLCVQKVKQTGPEAVASSQTEERDRCLSGQEDAVKTEQHNSALNFSKYTSPAILTVD